MSRTILTRILNEMQVGLNQPEIEHLYQELIACLKTMFRLKSRYLVLIQLEKSKFKEWIDITIDSDKT